MYEHDKIMAYVHCNLMFCRSPEFQLQVSTQKCYHENCSFIVMGQSNCITLQAIYAKVECRCHGTCSYLIGNVGAHCYNGNPPMNRYVLYADKKVQKLDTF